MPNHISVKRRLLITVPILIVLVFGCRHSASREESNPLVGWQMLLSHDYGMWDKAIVEDYKSYIDELPADEKRSVGPIQFFQDSSGQHAVRIEIALNGTDWAHVLIYDKSNKRVRVVKYAAGHYSS